MSSKRPSLSKLYHTCILKVHISKLFLLFSLLILFFHISKLFLLVFLLSFILWLIFLLFYFVSYFFNINSKRHSLCKLPLTLKSYSSCIFFHLVFFFFNKLKTANIISHAYHQSTKNFKAILVTIFPFFFHISKLFHLFIIFAFILSQQS